MEIFKRLITPAPPLSLQEEFAGVVARAVVEPSRDIEGLRGRNSPFEARDSGQGDSELAWLLLRQPSSNERKDKMKLTLPVVGIFILIIGACTPATTPIPAPTATADPTLTALPTSTSNSTALPTGTPTLTATATATVRPSETQTSVLIPAFSAPTATVRPTRTRSALPTSTQTPAMSSTATPTATTDL